MIVLSAGGHAGVVIDALRSMGGLPIIGVTDATKKGSVNGVPIIGTDAVIQPPAKLANGLGNRASKTSSGLERRKLLFQQFCELGCSFPVIVHASAICSSNIGLGEGAQILVGAVVQTGASIGQNAIVNTRAIVEHQAIVGHHSHIAPGAILCGGAEIGNEVHIGAGAIVLGGVKVGHGAVIAAGAVVTRNVAENSFVGRCSDVRVI